MAGATDMPMHLWKNKTLSVDDFILYPKKLQHRVSTKIVSDNATDIIIQAQSDRKA